MAGSDSVIYIDGGSFSCSGANSIAVYADGGTIIINDFSFSAVNGKKYGVDNGGQILVSKSCSADKPTGLSSGCTVTDNGDGYWLIKEN